VVGTGGKNHYSITATQPNSQAHNDDTYGVLRLTLSAGGYDWRFLPEVGSTFTDSGTGQCH
jgi:acid phosphatase type 7